MATLVTRPGDPQALKAAAAAAAADTQLAVLPLSEAGAWKKLLGDAADPAAARQLLLVTPDGGALTEPNAMARYLGAQPAQDVHCYRARIAKPQGGLLWQGLEQVAAHGPGVARARRGCSTHLRGRPPRPCRAGGGLPPQLDLGVESWVEWEERCLRPAVYSGDSQGLAAAVRRVADGLAGGRRFLAGAGAAPSLADFVVYATLSPLAGAPCCGAAGEPGEGLWHCCCCWLQCCCLWLHLLAGSCAAAGRADVP